MFKYISVSAPSKFQLLTLTDTGCVFLNRHLGSPTDWIVIHAARIVNQTLGKLCPCRKVVKPASRRLFYRSDNFPSNDSYYINTVDQIIIRLSLTFYSLNYRVWNAQFWIIDKIQSAKLIWNQLFSWAIAFGSNGVLTLIAQEGDSPKL